MVTVDQIYAALVYMWSEVDIRYPAMGFIIAVVASSLRMWSAWV